MAQGPKVTAIEVYEFTFDVRNMASQGRGERFCQNSALTMKSSRSKYMIGLCI
jgi:hypothetical protein